MHFKTSSAGMENAGYYLLAVPSSRFERKG
jgi:hypothetical protein